MSKSSIRTKSRRDSSIERSPYNESRKRKSSTSLYSYDDSDIAYRSAPEYLRRLMNTSNGNVTRTHSASEMNLNRLDSGNSKYKAQEDYYDEIQLLKKELKFVKDDNSNLRAKIRRLEEDNTRKCKEIDNLYDPNKNGDLRRTLANSTTPTANVVINLKQRVFKLELQLKQKETIIDEIKNDPRWTKSTELEIQNRALFNELEKEKLERLNYIQHDYMISLDEETKNAIRKLEADKRELKVENENLMKKVQELENLEHDKQLLPRKYDESTDRNIVHKMEKLKEMCEYYENELEQMKNDLKIMRRERDKYRDKLEALNEDFEEIKRERDQHRYKSDRQTNQSLKQNSARPLNTSGRRNSSSSEELSKTDSK
ncbi:unnamed protein product [Adineta steineri]|nr:unnamed protein product [Adineta steineri]